MAIDPSLLISGAVPDPAAMAPPMGGIPTTLPVDPMQPMGMPIPQGVPLAPQGVPAMAAPPMMVEQPAPQLPPALLIPEWLIDEIAERNLERENELVDRVADVMGPPRDSRGYSLDEQVSMYLSVPEDLADEGDRDEVIASMRDDGVSEDEIMDHVYPLRRILFIMAGPNPRDIVRYAKRIHGIAMARLNGLPDPDEPYGSDHLDDDASDTSDDDAVDNFEEDGDYL